MQLLRVIRAAPRIHLVKLDPGSISTVFNVAFSSYLLHSAPLTQVIFNFHLQNNLRHRWIVNDKCFKTCLFCQGRDAVFLSWLRRDTRARTRQEPNIKKKKKSPKQSNGISGWRKERDNERGAWIMLGWQLFGWGEQLYPLKGIKPEPGQEPWSVAPRW